MKLIFGLLAAGLFALPVLPVEARPHHGGARQQKCFKKVYKEEYVPGNMNRPGYVRTYKKRVRIPCNGRNRGWKNGHHNHNNHHRSEVDDNSCAEGSVLGAIAGGGLGGALATKENWVWSIPTGIVTGAIVGCGLDGG